MGHPFIHRLLKDMVRADVEQAAQRAGQGESTLKLAKTIARIVLKHLDQALTGRAVFVLIQLLETPAT